MDNGSVYSFSRSYAFPNDYHYLDTAWYQGISDTETKYFILEMESAISFPVLIIRATITLGLTNIYNKSKQFYRK